MLNVPKELLFFLLLFCLDLFCRIVPNLEDDDSPTSKSDASDENELNDLKSRQITTVTSTQSPKFTQNAGSKALGSLKCLQSNPEDDEIGDGLRMATTTTMPLTNTTMESEDLSQQTHPQPFTTGKVERRRRKLPEIPKNRKCE